MVKRSVRAWVRLIREDWLLFLVAIVIAVTYWWNVTQRQTVTKFLLGVEVSLETNLKPSLRLSQTQTRPKVSVRVQGPRSLLDNMGSDSFLLNADLSGIVSAGTRQQVSLSPKDFTLKPHLIGALPAGQFRIARPSDIRPLSIMVETEWNQKTVPIAPRLGAPAKGYIVAASKVTPATITIAGSLSDLEQVESIHNRNEIALRGMTSVPDQYWTPNDLSLGKFEVLNWNPDKRFRLHVEIEPQFMDKVFHPVQVYVRDATDSRLFDYDPKQARVHLQGARLLLRDVTNESFALGIDLAKLPSGTHTITAKLLELLDLPKGLSILQVTPELISIKVWDHADYIIAPPETPIEPEAAEPPQAATADLSSATSPVAATAAVSIATVEAEAPPVPEVPDATPETATIPQE